MSVIWPLTGRAEELERLRQIVVARDVAGIILIGPAGVGKTRLAKECLAVGEAAGYGTALAVASRSAVSRWPDASAPAISRVACACRCARYRA